MKTIPVNIITGFLGSGKTTVISNLLKDKPTHEKWAVIINEFGSVAIDVTTLNSDFADGNTIVEVAGGCICCSSKDYFEGHLKEIVEDYSPDRILIEPTGLGGILMVKEVIAQFMALKTMPVICLADVRGADIERLRMNQIYLSQIRDSEIIVISKCDLENSEKQSEELLQWIKKTFNPKAHYASIENGILDSIFLSPEIPDKKVIDDALEVNIISPFHEMEDYKQKSFTYPADKQFDIDTLKTFFSDSEHIIRAKGHLNIGYTWILFNVVMGEFNYQKVTKKDKNTIVLISTKNIDLPYS